MPEWSNRGASHQLGSHSASSKTTHLLNYSCLKSKFFNNFINLVRAFLSKDILIIHNRMFHSSIYVERHAYLKQSHFSCKTNFNNSCQKNFPKVQSAVQHNSNASADNNNAGAVMHHKS